MNMTVEEALRIADIFEKDDVISVSAQACRRLANEVQTLRLQVQELYQREQKEFHHHD